MKFSFSKLTKQKEEQRSDKSVLFVCVENAGRSQMAEGFFRRYAPKGFMTLSAGTKPSGDINPINMGCMDKSFCPTLFIPNVIDWRIEDPKGKPIEKVRQIRDDIDAKVRHLAAELNKDSMQANL